MELLLYKGTRHLSGVTADFRWPGSQFFQTDALEEESLHAISVVALNAPP